MPAKRVSWLLLCLALVLADQLAAAYVPALLPSALEHGRFFAWAAPGYSLAASVCALAVLWRLFPRCWRPLGLLAAGLASNVLTFLRIGRFVDYLPTGISYLNVADLMIVVGAAWLAIMLARKE
jgi:lipoprotein signal peptidase